MAYAEDTDAQEQCEQAEDHAQEYKRLRMAALIESTSKARLGSILSCPVCGHQFIKNHPAQKFCGAKVIGRSTCKDYFHNLMKPSRLMR